MIIAASAWQFAIEVKWLMELEGISSIIIPHSFTPPTEIFYVAQSIGLLYLFLFPLNSMWNYKPYVSVIAF